MSPAVAVVKTSASRASGLPRLLRLGARLYLEWVEVGFEEGGSPVGLRELAAISIPAAG